MMETNKESYKVKTNRCHTCRDADKSNKSTTKRKKMKIKDPHTIIGASPCTNCCNNCHTTQHTDMMSLGRIYLIDR